MIIRAAKREDTPGIAHVHNESWRTTYRGMLPDEYLANLRDEDSRARWERAIDAGHLLYVAEDETGKIAGFVAGGPARTDVDEYEGELYAIYILDSHHGRGIGRLLVQALAKGFEERGMHSMLLWVMKGNPAQGFYEALGGQEIRTQEFQLAGVTIEEIAFGWKDIAPLIGGKPAK